MPKQTPMVSPGPADSPADSPLLWRCTVPGPLRTPLDYLPPLDSCTAPLPGVRVRVPLGRRLVTGVLQSLEQRSPVASSKLRRVDAVLDSEPLIPAAHARLLAWTAGYYQHPPGEVVAMALSPCERRGEPPAASGQPGLRLTLRGRGLPAGALARAPRQAQLLALLQRGPQTDADIAGAGITRAVVRELLAKDLAEACVLSQPRHWRTLPGLVLNAEQSAAVDAIAAARGFTGILLDGVTGSGKTEVYLEAMAATLARGRQTLMLIPEIGLTPQALARIQARIDAPLVLLHSGLSDRERDRGWSLARTGEAAVVIGTRSAAFCPLANPGLIIVDEEHDSGYCQQDGLRYSARDVAVKRAQICDCPIVLGSATPSTETIHNVLRGRYRHLRLTRRAAASQLPEVEHLDIRGLDLAAGMGERLLAEVAATLGRGEQALLFLNRRGFAPSLTCRDCGWVAPCRHCDARMTVHRQPPGLRCHHCAASTPLPPNCPNCGSRHLYGQGLGTEQLEAMLIRRFPGVDVLRVDSDNMRGRHAMAELRERLEAPGPVLLVGTQMLTKGHHFPRVTLVGVVDADALLFSADFRGEERLLQLLTQVGGRAGRAGLPGRVLIQTRHPDHPLIQRALTTPYWDLALGILADRERRGLPPAGALAALRCDSRSLDDGLCFLGQLSAAVPPGPATLIGPLPAALSRRAGLFRTQLVVSAAHRGAIATTVAALVSAAEATRAPAGLHWFVDIDPVETL